MVLANICLDKKVKNWFLQEYLKLISFIKKYKTYLILVVALASGIFIAFNTFFSEKIELMAFDERVKMRMKPASSDIVIVNIDNHSLDYIGKKEDVRFPFPRGIYGKVFKTISEGKPKAIVIDIRFENRAKEWDSYKEYSDSAFYNYIKDIPNLYFVHALDFSKKEAVNQEQKILNDKEIDKKYREKGLESFYEKTKEDNKYPYNLIKPFFRNSIITDNTINNKNIQDSISYLFMKPHLKEVYDNAKGYGIVNAYPNPVDKVLRSIKPVYKYYDGYLFRVSIEVVATLTSTKPSIIYEKDRLIINNKEIPLVNGNEILLNWRNNAVNYDKPFRIFNMLTYPSIRFSKVYDLEASGFKPDIFKDKIVLVGITTDKVNDYFKTPHRSYLFGVEVIATAIDNLLNDQQFIKRASELVNALICMTIITIIIIIYLVNPFSRYYYRNIMYCLAILMGYIFMNIFLFDNFGYWLDLINPLLCGIITLISLFTLNILVEKDKRAIVENTFSKYVSPQVFRQLLASYENIDLSTYRSEITILFSDIRGFTPFTESLEPEEVSRYLNEYFTEMVEVVLKHNGTVDKFMGDAIMAFFGAPVKMEDHAYKACLVAFEMMNKLNQLNEKWFIERGALLKIGVGINTGQALVGNFGSPRLMDYTVIGDSVNIASRLESLNKELKTSILISEQTYEMVKDNVQVIYMGPCELKGKTKAINVYELVDVYSETNTFVE